jgi:hypothetical protein
MADHERRIIVEVISHADVARLEARDEDLRRENAQLKAELDGLRRRLYEIMEAIGDIRRQR